MFERCQDDKQGKPGCLGIADSRFTMRFDDIGEAPIYWCSSCGAKAIAMNKALQQAFETRPGFFEELRAAVDEVTTTSSKK